MDPRIDKICEFGRVIVSAQYVFQSCGMPRVPDGSEDSVCIFLSLCSHHLLYTQDNDSGANEVCIFLSLCSHHLLYTQDNDFDAGSSDEELKSNIGSVNDHHEDES